MTNDSLQYSQKPPSGNTLTASISMIHLPVPPIYILVSQIISQSETFQLKFHMHFLHPPHMLHTLPILILLLLLISLSYHYTVAEKCLNEQWKTKVQITVHTLKWKCPFSASDCALCAMQPDRPYPTMTI